MKNFSKYSQDKYDLEDMKKNIDRWMADMKSEVRSPVKKTATMQSGKDWEEGYEKGKKMGVKIAATNLLRAIGMDVPDELNLFRD